MRSSPLRPATPSSSTSAAGEIITWEEALDRHPRPEQPNHTFYFHLDDSHVIDGKVQRQLGQMDQPLLRPQCGSRAGWQPRVPESPARHHPGEELFFDYGLVIDARLTPKLKKEYACWCGAKTAAAPCWPRSAAGAEAG